METIQLVLGIDKKHPLFNIYSSKESPETLSVYFGLALLERIEKGQNSLQFKLLIGRLYNMGYKRKSLTEAFKIDLKTIRKWGVALKSGDLTKMESAFAGHESRRKLTGEIESYARSRFREIFKTNTYNYSKIIRDEVNEHFKKVISAESLRVFFKEEKEIIEAIQISELNENTVCKLEHKSDIEINEKLPVYNEKCEGGSFLVKNEMEDSICESPVLLPSKKENNRKGNPSKLMTEKGFSHHLGIIIVLLQILKVTENLKLTRITRQWLISVLLGAQNIEQSRRLDFSSLAKITGMSFITSPRHQRSALKAGGTINNRFKLLKENCKLVVAKNCEWFYYDPHGIRYTGILKLLKGWCGNIGKTTKVYYQDFIHTSNGEPVFIKNYDNYYDLRERFQVTVSEFSQIFSYNEGAMNFTIDRGIYGHKCLSNAHRNGIGIITWEKGYKNDGWDEDKPICSFRILRYRNDYKDTITCDFDCIRYPFEKIKGFDRIIVRAKRERKDDIEVSVLINKSETSTEDAVKRIFNRWLQEGDFFYGGRHFGINQITSYANEDYGNLEESLIEKIVDTNEYIVLKLKKNSIEDKLRRLLLRKEKAKDENNKFNKKDKEKLTSLKMKLKELEKEMDTIEKKCAKEAKLVEQGAQKLKTDSKVYMDTIKITARNIFFSSFSQFRPIYKNFRNDHAVLRELTHASGFFCVNEHEIEITLYPAITVQPKVREKIQLFLDIVSKDIGDYFGKCVILKFTCGYPTQEKRGIFICD